MNQAGLVRKTMIGMALRRQRAGSGSSTEFLRNRTARVEWPDLREVLGDVRCAVAGAVATRHYMPERVTQDLDMVIAVGDAAAARQRLQAAGWDFRGELSIGGSSWASPDGVALDLVEGQETWWSRAIEAAQTNLDRQGLPVLPLPFLVLMKFRSGRTQDMADVSRMLGQADQAQLDETHELFGAEEPGGLEDLQSLIYLGQLEMGSAR